MSIRSDKPRSEGRSTLLMSVALLVLAAAITVGSLFYGYARDAEAEFGGADGQAEEVITEIDEDYEPWFSPFVGELPGEVESGLFALQAGLGGIVLGGAVGWYAGRNRGRKESLPQNAPIPSSRTAEGERGSD